MSATVNTMLELLAIPPAQRRKMQSMSDLASLVEEGLPAGSLRALQAALDMPVARFVQVVGISARNFTNLAKKRKLDVVMSDRLARIARIAAKAEEVFGERAKAVRWLHQPLVALAGKTPFEKMTTETGASRVEDVLTAIEHGVYV